MQQVRLRGLRLELRCLSENVTFAALRMFNIWLS